MNIWKHRIYSPTEIKLTEIAGWKDIYSVGLAQITHWNYTIKAV